MMAWRDDYVTAWGDEVSILKFALGPQTLLSVIEVIRCGESYLDKM